MKDKLIKAAKENIYQLDEFNDKRVLEQINMELEDILIFNDDNVLKKRQAYIGIGQKEDYLHRFIKTSEGTILAGIRHMGGNPDEPFVYMWPTFKIKNLKIIANEIKSYFNKFNPKSVRFWIRPDCNKYDVKIIQQRFIGKIDNMIKYDLPLVIPTEYYDWYYEQYKLLHTSRPDFIDRVPVNDKEMMNKCLNQGLLFQLKEKDKIIGLIAGEKIEFLGEPTVYIDEILVSSEHRGKGYGSKLLGSFINKLDAKYLTCHIDSENIASTKTALRAGEKIFSQECSFEFK